MHGVLGELALRLVTVAPKRGEEQRFLLNMVALIVKEIILTTKPAITVLAQVLYYYQFCTNA